MGAVAGADALFKTGTEERRKVNWSMACFALVPSRFFPLLKTLVRGS
jgi:hypothetical protein